MEFGSESLHGTAEHHPVLLSCFTSGIASGTYVYVAIFNPVHRIPASHPFHPPASATGRRLCRATTPRPTPMFITSMVISSVDRKIRLLWPSHVFVRPIRLSRDLMTLVAAKILIAGTLQSLFSGSYCDQPLRQDGFKCTKCWKLSCH